MRFEQKNDKLEEWLWNCAVKFTPGTWVLTESWTSSQQQLAQHCSTLGLPGRSQGTMLLIPERWKTCSVEMCQQKNSLAIILANPQPKPKPRYQGIKDFWQCGQCGKGQVKYDYAKVHIFQSKFWADSNHFIWINTLMIFSEQRGGVNKRICNLYTLLNLVLKH